MVVLSLAMSTLAPLSGRPSIQGISLVEPATLCVEVKTGAVRTPSAIPNPAYKPGYTPPEDWVHRVNGEDKGAIVGSRGQFIQPAEQAAPATWMPPSDEQLLTVPITLNGRVVKPIQAGRKSFPGNLGRIASWKFDGERIHRLYFRLPSPAPSGQVRISLPGLAGGPAVLDSRRTRSEGIRVNQVGYRPTDPDKSALFTLWLGSLGPSAYRPTQFEVLDAKTLKPVFRGEAALHSRADKPDSTNGDFSTKAPVYLLDFTPLSRPGRYRIHLPGVGCSYDFIIGSSVWEKAFAIGAKGFYYQRNGIAHGKPYTWYTAPRSMHEADGVKVYASTTPLMDSGNGLDALGTDKDNFGNLVRGATNQVVKDTWGGYKDAGDWDTRIQHLEASRMLLELAELFPAQIARVNLNIPESKGAIPDVIAEAQWNIDHYRRLMTPEGGVRGGVEFEEHPMYGETSWNTRLRLFTYAPDPWCSWLYAASAARLAATLAPVSKRQAAQYLATAEKAYAWGTRELARLNRAKLPDEVLDSKALAAAELFRTTRKPGYQADLLSLAKFTGQLSDCQAEAAQVVARTGLPAALAAQARAAVLAQADQVVEQTKLNSLRQGHVDDYRYPGYGRDVSPTGGKFLIWAHTLTGNRKYLAALLQSNGFLVGINTTNTVFTSGVGSNPTKWPFMIDPRYHGGGRMPAGITVYGPLFYDKEKDGPWFMTARPFMYPEGEKWPQSETWFDSFWTIMMNEFTINQSLGPTAHTWGYLAFRK